MMNIYSKYFTVEELHFHLWNEIYNFVDENWDKCETKIPVLSVLKHKIMQEFRNKGIVYEYKDVHNDCFLCSEYGCGDCPLKRAYKSPCMYSYYYFLISYFSNISNGEKEDKKTVLLCVARVRDCYSCLNGDC